MASEKKVDFFSTFTKTIDRGKSTDLSSKKRDILFILNEVKKLNFEKMVNYVEVDPKELLYELKDLQGMGLVSKDSANNYVITNSGKQKINF